jgi:hypothetical protein
MPTLSFDQDSTELGRLLAGNWPKKRNLVIITSASSITEGKSLLQRLRASIPY